jgi:hypothetical protein
MVLWEGGLIVCLEFSRQIPHMSLLLWKQIVLWSGSMSFIPTKDVRKWMRLPRDSLCRAIMVTLLATFYVFLLRHQADNVVLWAWGTVFKTYQLTIAETYIDGAAEIPPQHEFERPVGLRLFSTLKAQEVFQIAWCLCVGPWAATLLHPRDESE